MRKIIDLSGKKFNRLTVVKESHKKNGHIYWVCRCDCGNEKAIKGYDINSGHTKSCGCFRKAASGNRRRTHGKTGTPEHRTWMSMHSRCYNKKTPNYKNYGGRDISVSSRWKVFENFLKDMGEKPFREASLDRINNSGNYSLENCRWASRTDQANNRRSNRLIAFRNKTMNITQWAKELNVKPFVLYARLKLGWSDIDTLLKPVEYRSARRKRKHPQ